MIQMYLVGGAVRDKLLGLHVTERDYVVVGATVEEMLAQGFEPVGQAFPVFLHPKTHEEYALARTERKSGRGYQGFTFFADTSVTLQQDLARRDLTINAMAEDAHGNIIDVFGGQKDLQDRWLRHVSAAFVEDPVRLLRVGRFLARFETLGFKVHPTTMQLLQTMVQNQEVSHLVKERVWRELSRAHDMVSPWAFWQVLAESGALSVLFPELAPLFTEKVMQELKNIYTLPLPTSNELRLAAAWAVFFKEQEFQGIAFLKQATHTMGMPQRAQMVAIRLLRSLAAARKVVWTDATPVFEFLQCMDIFKQDAHWKDFFMLFVTLAPAFGVQCPFSAETLENLQLQLLALKLTPEECQHFQGPALGQHLVEKRISFLQTLL